MHKIICKFIKEFDNPKKRNDYILDFKNNLVCYKNAAIYKVDLSLFNYDYMAENGVKLREFDFLYKPHNIKELSFEYITKINNIECYTYRNDDILINVDRKYVDMLDSKIEYDIKGLTDRSVVEICNSFTGDRVAYVLPVARRC